MLKRDSEQMDLYLQTPGTFPAGVRNVSERALGVVYTPRELVEFMVHLAQPPRERCRVLEPACADAPFLTAFANRYGYHHELVGVEIDTVRLALAKQRLPTATFVEADFLLWEPSGRFDVVIGNPPYGIIGDESQYPIHVLRERKAAYRQRCSTWRGKFNIYGAFIEHATRLLAPDGRLVFVVPASWLVLQDFQRLRTYLAQQGGLRVYYLGKAFPKRNVSVVVMVLQRGAQGLELYDGMTHLALRKSWYSGEIIRFETAEWLEMEQGGVPLGEVFTIRFAARSPEVRRHPLVRQQPLAGDVPILTGRNLHAGWIDYNTCYSGYWMHLKHATDLRYFYGFPHLVVGHTKGTRVVAAVDERCYPWREEFHLIPKVEGIDLRAVAEYLNSERVQRYMQALYRDFVPHLTSAMMQSTPLPLHLVKHF